MVLPPTEVLLVWQWACGDLGLAMVWRQCCQAQCDGGGSGVCHGPAEVWYGQSLMVKSRKMKRKYKIVMYFFI